ncbi:serine/threonine dehydratase [Marinithermofilum abyssi]|uniref:threonine ammonia-lyase n=1 Tax=Marinithermofilum abyssi TaxID=1571185 RepID=A0A8J2YEJ0_9BACL|nr:pyridoxal-phosphate dependent enzyme [Marinithermofilum abyssi]GGE24544.1 serine/threonine dehydratase [Marinithermofilum abyssi]
MHQLPVSFYDIQHAMERLRPVVHTTPVMTSRTLNRLSGRDVFLKCENFQRGGAFKFRGAYNTLAQLSPEAKQRGVVAFSSGNHAQAVALAASLLNIPATICMPQDAPRVKAAATRDYGAEIVVYDRLTEDREQIARNIAAREGKTLIPPFDDPRIIAGAGTAAWELLEEISDLDAAIAPIGGGGLLSGTALAVKGQRPSCRVFGVEPDQADDARQSLHSGQRTAITPPDTIADGLRVPMIGEIPFAIMQHTVEDIVTVSEAEIKEALQFAFTRLKIVIEPSSAVPLAALLNGKLPPQVRRIGIIVSGGNVDPALLGELFSV